MAEADCEHPTIVYAMPACALSLLPTAGVAHSRSGGGGGGGGVDGGGGGVGRGTVAGTRVATGVYEYECEEQ